MVAGISEAGFYEATSLKGILYGAGCISKLPELTAKLVSEPKVLVVTGKSLAALSLCKRITDLLGEQSVGVFSKIREHAPVEDIETCLDLIDERGATVIVSFGGGSPVDACKVLTYKHHERHPEGPWVFNIAVPTTLSAAEYSTIGGHTSRDKVKIGVMHHENLYRPSKSIFHTINAIAAVRMLFENLPRCKAEPDNLKVREQLLLGAALGLSWAEFSLAMGPSHSLGHRFGASAAVPHGICSCLTLAPTLALMHNSSNKPLRPEDYESIDAAVAVLPARFRDASPAGTPSPLVLSKAVELLIAELDLTSKFSEYKVVDDATYDHFTKATFEELHTYSWTDDTLPTYDELKKLLASC